MSLRHDDLGFALRCLDRFGRGPLGGNERRGEQGLPLLEVLETPLRLLEPVGEVAALPPDVLEAVGDVGEDEVCLRPLVAADDCSAQPHVSQLNGCVPHLVVSFL